MKTCHAIKHAERRYLGEDVVIIGGGIPTRGIVKAVSANNGRIYLKTKVKVGKDTLICTFPVESVVLVEAWMILAANYCWLSAHYNWYERVTDSYMEQYNNLADQHDFKPAELYHILKALNLV